MTPKECRKSRRLCSVPDVYIHPAHVRTVLGADFQSVHGTQSFIHFVVCLTTGPKFLPKRALHIVRSRGSSFRCEYPVLYLRSSSSFLRLLPRLPVTSIPPFIFPSITCRRRQFLLKICQIQLAFRLIISCRISLCSLTLSDTSSFLTWSVQLIFSILLQHHISELSRIKYFIICCRVLYSYWEDQRWFVCFYSRIWNSIFGRHFQET
jgi:hypothetical protein